MGLDRQVRIFKFATGKLYRKYDESLAVLSEMQQAGTSSLKLDDMEFGRRLAIEREIDKSDLKNRIDASTAPVAQRQRGSAGSALTLCVHSISFSATPVFDASGHLILYATLLGVKGALAARHRASNTCVAPY